MYLVVSDYVVSVFLVQYIQDKEQKLVYYVSKAMIDVEIRYSRMEQTTLALKMSLKSSTHTSKLIK